MKNNFRLIENLNVPKKKVDAVLDTDTFNEVDDQFALAYMIKASDKINLKAIYAAPFFNGKSTSPKDGMLKSYDEIMHILDIMGRENLKQATYRGSENYMENAESPVDSDAMRDLIDRARGYTSENPLYVVCIAAITNVASAIVAAPDIADKIVIVWLGGHDIHNSGGCEEFNMMQDIAASRVVFSCIAPLVQLPCNGVVSSFRISEPEFNYWLKGKNALCDYLVDIVIDEQEEVAGKPWARIIWDVTAVAWLLNDEDKFMESSLMQCRIPEPDMRYATDPNAKIIRYVNYIKRDNLLEDLIKRLTADY